MIAAGAARAGERLGEPQAGVRLVRPGGLDASLHEGDRHVPRDGRGGGERERDRARGDDDRGRDRAEDPQPDPAGDERDDDAGVGGHDREADQPYSADGGERQQGGMLPLARAQHSPRAAECLPGPDPLDHQPVARQHDQRGQRARRADRPAQQRPGRDGDAGPQHADHDRHQQQPGPDLRGQPVQDGHQEAGAEPPAAHRGLPGARRGAHQQQPGNQAEPGQELQVGVREGQRRQRAREEGRIPNGLRQAPKQSHDQILRQDPPFRPADGLAAVRRQRCRRPR